MSGSRKDAAGGDRIAVEGGGLMNGPGERLPISVLLLARDEEQRLAALLPALAFAREVVVVVDAASRDGTREIAAQAGARVFERVLDGFGPQRQFGLERCREQWVLWVDADERLDDTARRALPLVIARPGVAGFTLLRRTWFLGKLIRHSGWQGERVLRLFRREAASFDATLVHERVEVRGHIEELPGTLEHRSYETWRDCHDKLLRYASAGAAEARRRGRRAGWLDLVARPPLRFFRSYVLQAGFLDGIHGAAVCGLAAVQVFLKYAELWADTLGRAADPDHGARRIRRG
jgi:glycosyltransferase involved in cell wall biosynthesis